MAAMKRYGSYMITQGRQGFTVRKTGDANVYVAPWKGGLYIRERRGLVECLTPDGYIATDMQEARWMVEHWLRLCAWDKDGE